MTKHHHYTPHPSNGSSEIRSSFRDGCDGHRSKAVGGYSRSRKHRYGGENGFSLTHYEIEGLKSGLSLADGHASHEPQEALKRLVVEQPSVWADGPRYSAEEHVSRVIEAWARLANEPAATKTRVCIAPTASNSIDITSAALKARSKTTHLVTPTFDNLASLARRRAVDLRPLPQEQLDVGLEEFLGSLGKNDALFLVVPNNPTGSSIGSHSLNMVFQESERLGFSIVIDRTFRFYESKSEEDLIGRLQRSGASFVVIEDTGKTWPTQDRKISPIFYSEDWADTLQTIYEEIYLCPSIADVAFFKRLFDLETKSNFPGPLRDLVKDRRNELRAALAGSALVFAPESRNSTLPVEWLDISATGLTDIELVRKVETETGVHLLPGAQFFWDQGLAAPRNRARVSLLRPELVFEQCIDRLAAFVGRDF